MFVAVAGPRCRSQRSCLVARDQILAVSADRESGIHVWSRSFCHRISKHFRSGKLFLSQKARRLESQKTCYGGILYVFLPPRSLSTGERFSARPDNTGNLTSDSHLPQPSYTPDLLPLYCWGLLQGFFITYIAAHIIITSLPAPHMKGKGKVHVTTAPGLFEEGGGGRLWTVRTLVEQNMKH